MFEEITLSFGVGGNSGESTRTGWSNPEPDFCWTVGLESIVVMANPPSAVRYQLSLDVRPHLRQPRLLKQILIVAVNDLIVNVSEITDNMTITCEVPRLAIDLSDELTLRLLHPNAESPKDIVGIDDDRVLAIAVERIVLRCFGRLDEVGGKARVTMGGDASFGSSGAFVGHMPQISAAKPR